MPRYNKEQYNITNNTVLERYKILAIMMDIKYHIEEMKRLACAHDGLNAYINRNKPGYSSKR